MWAGGKVSRQKRSENSVKYDSFHHHCPYNHGCSSLAHSVNFLTPSWPLITSSFTCLLDYFNFITSTHLTPQTAQLPFLFILLSSVFPTITHQNTLEGRRPILFMNFSSLSPIQNLGNEWMMPILRNRPGPTWSSPLDSPFCPVLCPTC